MPQRVQNLQTLNDHPFTGQGVSLYAQIGTSIRYRNLRIIGGRPRGRTGWIKGGGGVHDIAADPVQKTARVASSETSPLVFALPAEFAEETVTFDLRHYLDDVENESNNYRTVRKVFDGDLEEVNEIIGTATLLSQQIRDGGVVRLRIAYLPNRDGVQPTVFKATRTAGPTSPAVASVTVSAGTRLVEIDTPALSDASAYTYSISAENGAGSVTKTLLTGISVTADATGPAAPTNAIATAV